MQVEISNGEIVVDARLIGEMLGVPAGDVPQLLRTRSITSVCERGVDADEGLLRLSFFYRSRRARLSVDLQGRILRRSRIDFGDRIPPRAAPG
jgi:hypothetical protein